MEIIEHKNLEILNTVPRHKFMYKYLSDLGWDNFCQSLPKQKWVRNKLACRQKGKCAYCGRDLKENCVVHHITYDYSCKINKDIRDKLPCQFCEKQDECLDKVALVCRVCNVEMQNVAVAQEKLEIKKVGKLNNLEEHIQRFENLVKYIKRPGFDKLLAYVQKSDFYTAPASTHFHLSVEGGLLQHSLNVFDILKDMLVHSNDNRNMYEYKIGNSILAKIDYQSLILISLFHDICKTNFYSVEKRNKKIDGQWKEVDFFTVDDKCPYGHGEKSVMMLEQFIKLTKQERMAIRWHMGMPEDWAGKNSYFSAVEMYPLVLALHTADMMAAKFVEGETQNKILVG